MKKLRPIFLILLFITGCQQTHSNKQVITNIEMMEQTGIQELQDESIPEQPAMPVVGNSKLIVIDPGHQRYGNSEQEPIGPGASQTKAKVTSGATGIKSGKLESQINLEVGLKLKTKLEASGYQVMMTRTSQDVNLSNKERAMFANDSKASAFIRLHCNSDDSSSVNGTLTIAPSKNNQYCSMIADTSQQLSKKVLNNICNQTGSKNRGVLISDMMSGINWCLVPVTIVEMGFLSNYNEDYLLGNSDYQDKIVNGIVLGINEFLEN